MACAKKMKKETSSRNGKVSVLNVYGSEKKYVSTIDHNLRNDLDASSNNSIPSYSVYIIRVYCRVD